MLHDLPARLELAEPLLEHTLSGGWSLFGALAVTAFLVLLLRGAIASTSESLVSWLLGALVIVYCLSDYRDIVGVLVDATASLTDFFAEQAGWSVYWDQVSGEFEPLLSQGETSQLDRLMGWLRAGALTVTVSVAYYLQFVVWEWIGELGAILVSLLYVLGPLSLGAAAVRPELVRIWFMSLIYVLLWQPTLPFLMWATLGMSGNAIETGNVALMIRQSAIMTLLSLATPLIALFVMGGGGFASFAAGASAMVGAAASGGIRLATDAWRRFGAFGTAAAALGGGAGDTGADGGAEPDAKANGNTNEAGERPGDASALGDDEGAGDAVADIAAWPAEEPSFASVSLPGS